MAKIKDRTSGADEEFWAFVQETSREVAEWPDWMKGGTSTLQCESKEDLQSGEPTPRRQPASKRREHT